MTPPPAPVDPRILALLGEIPADLFPPAFVAGVEAIERYGRAWARELARELDLEAAWSAGASPAAAVASRGLLPRFACAVEWLFAQLARDASEPAGSEAQTGRASLRAEILALDARNAPTLDLLDAAGHAYPAVARGEKSGEAVLLGPAGMGLWAGYFRNDNPVYAINNQVAALAAAHRLPAAGALRLLEVGAGGGSGSSALLAEIAQMDGLPRIAHYAVTEPSPFFRRRSQRELPVAWPGVPFAFADLDIDRPWGEQGPWSEPRGEPASCDLVFGVNVLHVAKDLPAALGEAWRALRPGGWLVAGECLRPFPGQPMAAEMIFHLLEGFTGVSLLPELRPNPGFLTPEQWRGLLAQAGFVEVTIVPDVERIRELTPSFLTAAVCGRRP